MCSAYAKCDVCDWGATQQSAIRIVESLPSRRREGRGYQCWCRCWCRCRWLAGGAGRAVSHVEKGPAAACVRRESETAYGGRRGRGEWKKQLSRR